MNKQTILIIGADGYLGWPTAMHFSHRGWSVIAVDSFSKRQWEHELDITPLKPVKNLHERARLWNELTGKEIQSETINAVNHRELYKIIEKHKPSTIVHYGEQPSAPFSMIDRSKAVETQTNNITGTLNIGFAIKAIDPEIHLIKLGTMGEYGQPNIDIEEGWIEIEHKGRKDKLMYPKSAGSFYHLSKVHDSNNLEFMCRTWGNAVTDLNQGIVYGIDTPETRLHADLNTSFHYDDIFGTVVNRFMTQAAAEIPLTIYGSKDKTRAMLNINDTLKCVELAANNPARTGEFRVFNQFTEQVSIGKVADYVTDAFKNEGIAVKSEEIPNPRVEKEEHYFNAENSGLIALGLNPITLKNTLKSMTKTILEFKENIRTDQIMPRLKWKQ